MKILSIETSGSICGVALSVAGSIASEFNSYAGNQHDKLLAEYVRRILNDNEMKVEDLDAVAVSAGPGSFTGVRIGGALAKSLCFGGSPRLIAVPTLSAIAKFACKFVHNFTKICVATKSHKDLIYAQFFDKNGFPASEIIFDTHLQIEKMIDESTMLCGNGFQTSDVYFGDGITAKMIAQYADYMYNKNQFTDPNDYVPLYVQEFQPKTNV